MKTVKKLLLAALLIISAGLMMGADMTGHPILGKWAADGMVQGWYFASGEGDTIEFFADGTYIFSRMEGILYRDDGTSVNFIQTYYGAWKELDDGTLWFDADKDPMAEYFNNPEYRVAFDTSVTIGNGRHPEILMIFPDASNLHFCYTKVSGQDSALTGRWIDTEGQVVEFYESGDWAATYIERNWFFPRYEYMRGVWLDLGEGQLKILGERNEIIQYEINSGILSIWLDHDGRPLMFNRPETARSPLTGHWKVDPAELAQLIFLSMEAMGEYYYMEYMDYTSQMSFVFMPDGTLAVKMVMIYDDLNVEGQYETGYWLHLGNDRIRMVVDGKPVDVSYKLVDGVIHFDFYGAFLEGEGIDIAADTAFRLIEVPSIDTGLVGEWVFYDFWGLNSLEFFEDGTLYQSPDVHGTWLDVGSGRLKVSAADDDETFIIFYTIFDGCLVFTYLEREAVALTQYVTPPPSPVMGAWETAAGESWRFLPGGILQQDGPDGVRTGGWVDLGGGRVRVTLGGDVSVFMYEAGGSVMTLRHGVYGLVINLWAISHPVIGKWEDSGGVLWDFHRNGILMRGDDMGTWTDLGDGRVLVSISGDESVFVSEADSIRLSLTHELFNFTIRFGKADR
ncbi:MAG: hypothetical protein FWE91_10090 [Defluviitaleaceae bacterium]|nr:hypothetical protein [Defluviitaleaceae bacterium]MCL2835799.1 hypothetical protein [Defluviitaleaceae bacterium]